MNILLVEDDETHIDFIRMHFGVRSDMLGQANIIVVDSGRIAVRLLERNPKFFQIMITDNQLGDISEMNWWGNRIIKKVRSGYIDGLGDMKMILMSSEPLGGGQEDLSDAFLLKRHSRVDIDELADTIKTLLSSPATK